MRLRLPRWLRREPVPQGRHVRRPAPVTAPGAGAALVIGAAEPYLVAPTPPDPAEPPDPVEAVEPAAAAELPPVGPEAVTAGDVGLLTEPIPVLAPVPLEPPVPAVVPVALPDPEPPQLSEYGAEHPEPGPGTAGGPEPTVALGFADGGVLELAPDDPRLAGFHDAAAAVLGRPEP